MGTIINSAAPLQDRGKVIGGVVVTEDITKQRELEHEAIAAKERAELYIDLLTHDINNMNTAARGFLQLAEDEASLDDKSRQRLVKCQAALDDIADLIEKVKKIQRIEAADARRGLVDLGWTIEDVVQSFKDFRKGGGDQLPAAAEAHGAGDRPAVRCVLQPDRQRHQALRRAGDNRRQHQQDLRGGSGVLPGHGRGRRAGRPGRAKQKIFSRLQRGKTRASGSGLGLFLVRSLVEDFQGRVWVEDRVAGDHTKGAKFVVMLPAVAMPEGAVR